MYRAEGEAVPTGKATRGGPHALAHGLLLEAVDAIRQANELIGDDEASVVLSRHADDLTRIANRLPTRPR